MADLILLSIFAYLLGSASFGHIFSRMKKVDITKLGSKSPTSTNISRALGWRWGFLTAILDFSKAIPPVLLAKNILEFDWQIVMACLFPTLGHIFPVFFGFKGGKGGATFLGTCMALFGFKVFILIFFVWLLIFAFTRMTSVTNLIFPWSFALFLYLCQTFPSYYSIIILLEAVIITFALRSNIKRLLQGNELKTPLKI